MFPVLLSWPDPKIWVVATLRRGYAARDKVCERPTILRPRIPVRMLAFSNIKVLL